MGNIQPTGTSSKSTPPSTPRGNRTGNGGLNFQAVALGHAVQSMEGHAQGAPSSPTITPLPSNATVSVLTPQQLSAFGPPVTRQQIVGELKFRVAGRGKMKCTLPVAGVDETSASDMCRAVAGGLRRCGIAISDERVEKDHEKGIVIRCSAKKNPRQKIGQASELTMGLIRSLLDIGSQPFFVPIFMNFQVVWDALSNRKDWKLNGKRDQDDPDVLLRKECIRNIHPERMFGGGICISLQSGAGLRHSS